MGERYGFGKLNMSGVVPQAALNKVAETVRQVARRRHSFLIDPASLLAWEASCRVLSQREGPNL
jgi:hypothetical protein